MNTYKKTGRGEGANRHPMKDVCPELPAGARDLSAHPTKGVSPEEHRDEGPLLPFDGCLPRCSSRRGIVSVVGQASACIPFNSNSMPTSKPFSRQVKEGTISSLRANICETVLVLLINEQGEKDAMHTHPSGWYYVTQPGTMKIAFADGKVATWEAKQGEGGWLQTKAPHAAENVGKTTLVYVLVEVKCAEATRSPAAQRSEKVHQ